MTDASDERKSLLRLSTKFNDLTEALKSPSEMVFVIASTSFIDLALKTLLEEHFRKSNLTDGLFKPSGALGTIKAKTDVAYALGLIGASARHNLEKVADIRNQFAHNLGVSFEDDKVKKACDNFKMSKATVEFVSQDEETQQHLRSLGKTRKAKFRSLVGTLAIVINQAAIRAKRVKPGTDIYWRDLQVDGVPQDNPAT